jgi:hypothetical protein
MSATKTEKPRPLPKLLHWMGTPDPYVPVWNDRVEIDNQGVILKTANFTELVHRFKPGSGLTWFTNPERGEPAEVWIKFPDPKDRFFHSLSDLPVVNGKIALRALLFWELDPAKTAELKALGDAVFARRKAEYQAFRSPDRDLPMGGVLYCKDGQGASDLCIQSEDFPVLTPFERLNLSQMDDAIRHAQRLLSLMQTKRRVAAQQFEENCKNGTLLK